MRVIQPSVINILFIELIIKCGGQYQMKYIQIIGKRYKYNGEAVIKLANYKSQMVATINSTIIGKILNQ